MGRGRRKQPKHPLSTSRRNKAVQAFWAMHVEAMNWSGMSLRDYAAAHHLSSFSLRRWRNLLDTGEVEIDWRAHLHPSARPQISTGASTGAKECRAETGLTNTPMAVPPLDGRSNRRSFTDEEKRAIVMEAEQPGVSVAAVARRHEIVTSMIFRWRVQLGLGRGERAEFASVQLADKRFDRKRAAPASPLVLHELLPIPDSAIAVELADGRRVFAPADSDPEVVRRHIAEREAQA